MRLPVQRHLQHDSGVEEDSTLPDGRQVPYREYGEFFEKNVEAFHSGR
jgi:hypothetical protein